MKPITLTNGLTFFRTPAPGPNFQFSIPVALTAAHCTWDNKVFEFLFSISRFCACRWWDRREKGQACLVVILHRTQSSAFKRTNFGSQAYNYCPLNGWPLLLCCHQLTTSGDRGHKNRNYDNILKRKTQTSHFPRQTTASFPINSERLIYICNKHRVWTERNLDFV